ncbi:hypothetical protein Ate01nite_61560 [Actinoplanes teichomyceticus]|nr:hypothetical protein Ate01nite_61560 [Actinoplanes teichomyceticus]
MAARMRALHGGGPARAGDAGELTGSGGPLRWSDIVPGWSDVVAGSPGVDPGASGVVAGAPGLDPGLPGLDPGLPGVVAARPDRAGGSHDRIDSGGEGRGLPGGSGTAGEVPLSSGVSRASAGPGVAPVATGSMAPWTAGEPVGRRVADEPVWPPPVAGPASPDGERPFDERYAWRFEEAPALPGTGAFGEDRGGSRKWLHAFDPGRPGVRAMAVVAVVVVLVAAFLAWRARPRVDQIAPGSESTPASSADPGAAGPVAATAAGAPAEVVVAVGGKVRTPGLVRLAPGARVADALTAAGGADPGVDVAGLNLARKVTDGELIMVGVSAPPGATTAPAAVVPGAGGAVGGLVNLNTATLAELDRLPGVGPVLAQRILDARDAQGGFRAVGDLRKVDGIGDARYEQLKDLVTV